MSAFAASEDGVLLIPVRLFPFSLADSIERLAHDLVSDWNRLAPEGGGCRQAAAHVRSSTRTCFSSIGTRGAVFVVASDLVRRRDQALPSRTVLTLSIPVSRITH